MVEGSSFEKVQGLKVSNVVSMKFDETICLVIFLSQLVSVIYVFLRWKESIELKNREQGGKLYLVESNVKS